MCKLSSFARKFNIILALLVVWLVAMPAQAFYLEVPSYFKDAWKVSRQKVLGEQTSLPQPPAGMQPNTSGQTCNINGQEMPGPCSNYNQGPMSPGGESFGPSGAPAGPNEEDMMKREQENRNRQLSDMKRGLNQMGLNLTRLERMFQSAEKKGINIPTEVKDKLTKVKETIKSVKAAQSTDEMGDIDMEGLNEEMRSLEEARQEYVEAAQRINDIKRNMRGLERDVKMFEKQIATLKRQKIGVPIQVTDNLDKLKAVIAIINNAKTWTEIENAGLDQIQEFMDNLQQSRQQLEMFVRWPQTLRDMDRQLKQLTSALKRSKSIVDRLQKKGIDLTSLYTDFEAAVNKLKAVRDEAVTKIQIGDAEIVQGIFESLPDDFFGQMEDVWQNQRVIQTMSNLGQFTREFKQGINQAQLQINRLKRQKIDTAELEDLFNQSKAKGNEILELVKVKPIDEEAITSGLMEMQELRNDFDNNMQELTGKKDAMPWENGLQQFNPPSLNFDINKFVPPPKPAPTETMPAEEIKP